MANWQVLRCKHLEKILNISNAEQLILLSFYPPSPSPSSPSVWFRLSCNRRYLTIYGQQPSGEMTATFAETQYGRNMTRVLLCYIINSRSDGKSPHWLTHYYCFNKPLFQWRASVTPHLTGKYRLPDAAKRCII